MTDFRIVNKASIDVEDVNRIVELAGVHPDRLILLFNDAPLFGKKLGCCVPKKLADRFGYSEAPEFRVHRLESWDCGIALGARECAMKRDFPAFFTYLLGHELGHAQVCMTDINLHVHCLLVWRFISQASGERISKWYQLPSERAFDRFGIRIAEQIHGRSALNDEIGRLLKSPEREDHGCLQEMRTLQGSDNLSRLRLELVEFTLPYKEQLIQLWREDHKRNGESSIASCIGDYEALFSI